MKFTPSDGVALKKSSPCRPLNFMAELYFCNVQCRAYRVLLMLFSSESDLKLSLASESDLTIFLQQLGDEVNRKISIFTPNNHWMDFLSFISNRSSPTERTVSCLLPGSSRFPTSIPCSFPALSPSLPRTPRGRLRFPASEHPLPGEGPASGCSGAG